MSDQFNGWGSQHIPYSQEAEEAVIGAVLTNPSAFFTVAAFLRPDDFFILRHQYIWQALNRITERNEPIDYVILLRELQDIDKLSEIGGPAYITGLINSAPSAVHAEVYGRLVERAATRRRLLSAADQIKGLALNEEISVEQVINESEAKLFDVTERQLTRELIPMRQAISDYYDRIEHLMRYQEDTLGIPSGFKDLDKLLGGFQKSDLLIFAGRPGMGKCITGDSLVPTSLGLLPIQNLKPAGVAGIPDDEGGSYYPLEIGVQTPDGLRRTAYFYDGGIKPTLRIKTRAGYSLTGTYNHRVLVTSEKIQPTWTTLDRLQAGQFIALEGQNWDSVVRVEPAGMQRVYDLTVPDGQAFVANGIVSHNTSFMLSAAINMARLGARIAIFSMEMGVEQIVQRLVSMEAAINTQSLRTGQITQQEWSRFVHAAGNLSNYKIFIDDTAAMSPLQLRTKSTRLAREHGLDLIVVDYMQLMNAGGVYENNRVQEISYISRSLKELARELNVPMLSAAQLSRAVEQRQDKRPQLSDLRESGCLTGESLVYLPDLGCSLPIRDLMDKRGFTVTSLNTETWKLEPGIVTNAFCTGVKPVYKLTTQLGRSIRATGNHKFFTIQGWKRLDELTTEDCIAVPRLLDGPTEQTMSDAELALLGHLIGDGCTLPNHALQYTTREIDLAETVADLATQVFGDKVKPRIHPEPGRSWYQVFIASSVPLTHGVKNPVGVWLSEMGAFGLRSHEKRIPDQVFMQPKQAIALFLRHLWATDGCVRLKPVTNGYYPNIYYATSSEQLAYDVQSLLIRVGINAYCRRIPQAGKGRDQFHISVSGKEEIERFINDIGAVGAYKQGDINFLREFMAERSSSSKRDYIPNGVWLEYIMPAIQEAGVTLRTVQDEIGMPKHSPKVIITKNLSRETTFQLGHLLNSNSLSALAGSDIYWDAISSIEPDGEEEVFDLTVEGNHDFVTNNIVVSNSIEQDADIVMFLYRDEVYNEATEFPNQADVIVAKHRNGPTGTISLYFEKTLTKFMNAAERSIDLSY